MSRKLFRLLTTYRRVRHLSAHLFRFYWDVFAWYPDGRVEKLSPGNVVHSHPCIHPDGSHVLFQGGSIGTVSRIWQAHLKSHEIKALTPSTFSSRNPVYSWDGSLIAFSGDQASGKPPDRIKNGPDQVSGNWRLNHHIYVMDNEGNHLKQVTHGPYYDLRPTFSPDGKHIAFVSNRSGVIQIWSLALDGSNEPQQILTEGWGFRPWYSADGKDIYFFSAIHRLKRQVFKIPARGGQKQPVPFCGHSRNEAPFIDQDGKTMLIHSDRTGKFSIWEIPLEGGKPRELLPPKFSTASHPTRSRNGIITFDVARYELKKMFLSIHK